jgi:hypothetical protein
MLGFCIRSGQENELFAIDWLKRGIASLGSPNPALLAPSGGRAGTGALACRAATDLYLSQAWRDTPTFGVGRPGQRPTQKRSLLSPLEAGGRLGRDRVHARPKCRDRQMVRPAIGVKHRLMMALPHRERPARRWRACCRGASGRRVRRRVCRKAAGLRCGESGRDPVAGHTR